MSEKIELEQLQGEADSPAARPGEPSDLRRLSDVPVEVAVEMGRANMTVGETLELRHGSIVTLNRMAGEPVDLLVNGTVIARGEVVVIDEQFGLRITDVLGQGAGGEASLPAEVENGDADVLAAGEAGAPIG
jgi:flagellar motor switch protein FliN/FliY